MRTAPRFRAASTSPGSAPRTPTRCRRSSESADARTAPGARTPRSEKTAKQDEEAEDADRNPDRCAHHGEREDAPRDHQGESDDDADEPSADVEEARDQLPEGDERPEQPVNLALTCAGHGHLGVA